MAEVLANGVRLHVQRLGQGDHAVVFLHGLVMDNLSSWYFTAATRVAQHAAVVLYDLRGHGRSERPASGYAVADHVADLHALLDALGLDRVTLVGNSFGGLLAVAFAAAHPERVAGLLLVDAHISAAGHVAQMAATLELTGEARDRAIATHFRDWLGRHSARKRNRLAENAEALVYGTSLVADLKGSPALDEAALAGICCPVRAIYGAESDVRELGERLAAALPDCTLDILPGCGHSVLWEATEQVCERLVEWVSR